MRLRLPLTMLAAALLLGAAFVTLSGAGTKTSTTTLSGGADGSAEVRCKKGQRVVGIGARGEAPEVVMKGQQQVIISEASRPGKRRARASGANLGGLDGDLTAIARCKKGPRSKLASETISVAPAGMKTVTESVTAKCPRGTRIVFGGFRAEMRPQDDPDNPIVIPTAAKRVGARGWTVEAFNLADGPDDAGELEALVYCGDVKKTEARTKTTSTGGFESDSVDARCPRGTKLRYGGFEGTNEADAASLLTAFHRVDGRTFRAGHVAFGATEADLTAIAYCR